MSTPLASLATLAVLCAAGALPTLALVGRRWTAVPLSVLTGAFLSALAATGFVALGGTLVAWTVALSVLGALVAGLWVVRGPSPFLRHARAPQIPPALFAVPAGLLVVAATAVGLRALSTNAVGFDARLIYFLHAGWLLLPHHSTLLQLRGAGTFAHAGYPPLVSAVVALGWQLAGTRAPFLASALVALLNACALVVAAWAMVEVAWCGRRHQASRRTSEARPSRPRGRRGRLGWLAPVVALVAALSLVVASFGVTEPFATNGYADPLWALSAVGAVVYGLVLPLRDRPRGSFVGVAVIFVAVAGYTKIEGTAVAATLVVLLTARCVADRWRRHQRDVGLRAPLVLGVLGLVVLGAWPAVVRLRHIATDTQFGGAGRGSDLHRLHATAAAMTPYLHNLAVAAGLAVVCTLCWPGLRRHLGLGADRWTWAAMVLGLAVLAGAYVLGPGNVRLWLVSSVHRVSEFPALLAWWEIGVWSVVAARAVVEVAAVRAEGPAPTGLGGEAAPIEPSLPA